MRRHNGYQISCNVDFCEWPGAKKSTCIVIGSPGAWRRVDRNPRTNIVRRAICLMDIANDFVALNN